MGIGDKVIFEGFCSDVPDRIKTYSMYVLSSDYEAISNSLMEAMALGLPCISTDCPIGGSGLCIENGVYGILIPVGDWEALRNAMIDFAKETECKNGCRLGRHVVRIWERFSEERIVDMWHDYIEETSYVI